MVLIRNHFMAALLMKASSIGSMPVRELMPLNIGRSPHDKPVHDRRSSRYFPHQGEREKSRRLRQLAAKSEA